MSPRGNPSKLAPIYESRRWVEEEGFSDRQGTLVTSETPGGRHNLWELGTGD